MHVLMKCDDVAVAVPIDILIQKSALLKSKLKTCNSSGEDESTEAKLIDLKITAEEIVSKEKESTDNPKISDGISAANAFVVSNEVVPTITMTGFDKEAVRIIFGDLVGNWKLEDKCKGVKMLLSVLEVCENLKLESMVEDILSRISSYKMGSIVDLTEIFGVAEKLETVEKFEVLSAELFHRCVAFARSNFMSWQVILDFVQNNKASNSYTLKLFAALKPQPNTVIRRRVKNIDNIEEEGPTYMVQNLQWKISCRKTYHGYLGLFVEVNNPANSFGDWSCDAEVEINLVDQKSGYKWHHTVNHIFTPKDKIAGVDEFKSWWSVTSDYCYLKDGTLIVEASITIKAVKGISSFESKNECDLGWIDYIYSKYQNYKKVEGSKHEGMVMLLCDKPIVIQKSLLADESEYFRTRLSPNWNRPALAESQLTDNTLINSVPITGFNHIATKALFEYINGFPAILKDILDFGLIGEMLQMCDYFGLPKPVSQLVLQIHCISLYMNNVLTAYKVCLRLKNIEWYNDVVDDLRRRCLALAGANLSTSQLLLNFLVNSSQSIEAACQLVKDLGDIGSCILRFHTDQLQGCGKVKSPSYIRANLLWTVVVEKKVDWVPWSPTAMSTSDQVDRSKAIRKGSARTKFEPLEGDDYVLINGGAMSVLTKHQAITSMKEYELESFEELRYDDYAAQAKEYFGVSLVCRTENLSTTWSCQVKSVEVKLLKSDDARYVSEKIDSHTFTMTDSILQWPKFKLWSDVFDEKNEFLRYGGDIRVEVSFDIVSSSDTARCITTEDMIT